MWTTIFSFPVLIFISENGLLMFLWVGANVAHEWTHSIFGDHLAAKIEIDPTSLPVFDNPLSRRLRQVIDLIRKQRHRSMKVRIILITKIYFLMIGSKQNYVKKLNQIFPNTGS